jgi:hypothetical protein
MSEACTCNDESQTQQVECFACKAAWLRPLAQHERVSGCAEHNFTIAICGTAPPPLCAQCKAAGYRVEASSSSFCPSYRIVKPE